MLKIIISKSTLCLILSLIRGVFVADTDKVKSVLLTEGDSVTLNTGVTEVQRTDQILWMFGPRETRIAEIYKQSIDMFDSNVTFRERLNIDSQTGSLTITNIRSEHSGLYKLNIISSRGNSEKRFSITVYAPLPVPVISIYSNSSSSPDSRCLLLCSVVNVSAASLSWYKGNSVLSSISVSNFSISLSLPLEVEYQDNSTYSCVVDNTIRNRTTHLDISQTCHISSKIPPSAIFLAAFISASVLAGLAAVMCFLYKRQKGKKHKEKKVDDSKPSTQRLTEAQTEQTEDTEVFYAETTFHPQNKPEDKANGTEEIIYSLVNMTR